EAPFATYQNQCAYEVRRTLCSLIIWRPVRSITARRSTNLCLGQSLPRGVKFLQPLHLIRRRCGDECSVAREWRTVIWRTACAKSSMHLPAPIIVHCGVREYRLSARSQPAELYALITHRNPV